MLSILGSLGLTLLLATLPRWRQAARHTTLLAAWWWGAAAVAVWTVVWVATNLTNAVSAPVADQLWYAVAVVALAPFVAVLGARRPGARAWTGFVVVPMLVVLGWPALAQLNETSRGAPLLLDDPALVAYALIALMGIGNYFSTRTTVPACVAAAALLLIVLPMTAVVPAWFPEPVTARGLATAAVSAAGVAVCWRQRRTVRTSLDDGLPFDRLWSDFRSCFGIAWAMRVQNRVNETAERERWCVRLDLYGFRRIGPDTAHLDECETWMRAEHTLRWLLRRFVDPEWIDQRLKEGTNMAAHTVVVPKTG